MLVGPVFVPLIEEVARTLGEAGVDLGALGLAWAKAMPTVALVPAFGLRALPTPARAVLSLALAAAVFPALVPVVRPDVPWALAAIEQVLAGLPIAVAAAVPLWAATMAGGLVDNLRGAQEGASVATVEGKPTPMGVPLSLLASTIFLSTGGPARVAAALARPAATHVVERVVQDLAGGIALAVAVGAPLLAAALVLEVAAALVARAAAPAQIHALLAPLRALGVLAVMAVVLDRIAAVIAIAVRS
jgi:type III secretory pathway component EscT